MGVALKCRKRQCSVLHSKIPGKEGKVSDSDKHVSLLTKFTRAKKNYRESPRDRIHNTSFSL